MTVQLEAKTETRRVSVGRDLLVGAAAAVAALAAWSFWTQVAGVDLVVHRGDSTQQVGAAAVAVTVLVMSGLGIGLLRFLVARTANGLRTWTTVAAVVGVVSLLGPLGATTLVAGIALVTLHAITASVLVLGLRQSRRHEQSAA
jgi:Family of unknown function (DUF6069)